MIGVCRWGRGWGGGREEEIVWLVFFPHLFFSLFFSFLSFFCVNNGALRERKTAGGAAGSFSSSQSSFL